MKKKVYLDNCCFNRPYDGQGQETIRLETEAKLNIQEAILAGELHFVWSFMLDLENTANPFDERRDHIAQWKDRADQFVATDDSVLEQGKLINQKFGIKPKDALHLACSISANCDFFITTDRELVKKDRIQAIKIISPIDFLFIMEDENEE